jgi:hypothetical protein
MFETMTAAKDELRKLKIIHESNGQAAGQNLAKKGWRPEREKLKVRVNLNKRPFPPS